MSDLASRLSEMLARWQAEDEAEIDRRVAERTRELTENVERLRHDRDRLRVVLETIALQSYECSDPECKAGLIASESLRGCDEPCSVVLKSEYVKLLESAFREIAALETNPASEFYGWWDSMCRSTACDYGNRLVALGLWERHPGGVGSRQWYRKLENEP